MISPTSKNKLPWKLYGGVFVVWLALMLPVGWIVWGSGPQEIQELEALQETPGVTPGLAQNQSLDVGAHGIWVTRPRGDDTYLPLEAFRVVGPSGVEQPLFFPPGETVTIWNDDQETFAAAVFRVAVPGSYSLYIDPEYVADGVGRFGPAWEEGQIIDATSGIMALVFGWVVTVGCATFALRKTVRSSPETVQ
jgi:hypothetical protein